MVIPTKVDERISRSDFRRWDPVVKRVEYLSSPARQGVLVGNRGRDDTPRNCIRHDNLGSRPSKGYDSQYPRPDCCVYHSHRDFMPSGSDVTFSGAKSNSHPSVAMVSTIFPALKQSPVNLFGGWLASQT